MSLSRRKTRCSGIERTQYFPRSLRCKIQLGGSRTFRTRKERKQISRRCHLFPFIRFVQISDFEWRILEESIQLARSTFQQKFRIVNRKMKQFCIKDPQSSSLSTQNSMTGQIVKFTLKHLRSTWPRDFPTTAATFKLN